MQPDISSNHIPSFKVKWQTVRPLSIFSSNWLTLTDEINLKKIHNSNSNKRKNLKILQNISLVFIYFRWKFHEDRTILSNYFIPFFLKFTLGSLTSKIHNSASNYPIRLKFSHKMDLIPVHQQPKIHSNQTISSVTFEFLKSAHTSQNESKIKLKLI